MPKEENFELESGQTLHLKKLKVNRIEIASIELLMPDNLMSFYHPIQYTQHLGQKIISQQIVPSSYLSLYARTKRTDKPINLVINFCKHTDIKISQRNNEEVVKYRIFYRPLPDIEIDVHSTRGADGYTFSLPLESKKRLKQNFPGANSPGRLFVSQANLTDFQFFHGPIVEYLPMALFGLSGEELKKVDFKLIDTMTSKVIHRSTDIANG